MTTPDDSTPTKLGIDMPAYGVLGSWTLAVEQLGKLHAAEVRPGPLTLLVGENNAGKTYLATLLYTLMAELPRLFPEAPEATPAYDECSRWVLDWFADRAPRRVMQQEDCELFLRWFNELLAEATPELLARAFNHEIDQPTQIEVRDLVLLAEPDLLLHVLRSSEDTPEHYYVGLNGLAMRVADPAAPSEAELYAIITLIASRLVGVGGEAVYLPTSRTGLVHLYRDVALRSSDSRRLRPRPGPAPAPLTTTLVDFVELLSTLDPANESRFADEARVLEAACLGGAIVVADHPLGRYHYKPAGAPEPLPMALASAVVTELAPLVLTLRHKLGLGLLILEEPEAHLHPRLQRILALVIVRLIRKGLRVCVTTHSENFCQQINNFIKIAALPDPDAVANSLGYAAGDHLASDLVSAYEFKHHGDQSVAYELRRSATGLQMPLFNNELLKLGSETAALHDLLEKAAGEAS